MPVQPQETVNSLQLPLVAKKSSSRSNYRIFARPSKGSIPPRESIMAYFSQFGPIIDCYLPESAINVAYVCFSHQSAMDIVLSMPEDSHIVDGVVLIVNMANPRPHYSVNTDRVRVMQVPEGLHRNILKQYFMQFGEVADVYIPKDKLTGLQKNIAYVTFRELSAARSVLKREFHCLNVHGSTLSLEVIPAAPRPHVSPSEEMSPETERSTTTSLLEALQERLLNGANEHQNDWNLPDTPKIDESSLSDEFSPNMINSLSLLSELVQLESHPPSEFPSSVVAPQQNPQSVLSAPRRRSVAEEVAALDIFLRGAASTMYSNSPESTPEGRK